MLSLLRGPRPPRHEAWGQVLMAMPHGYLSTCQGLASIVH
jgi:hypothetical protein